MIEEHPGGAGLWEIRDFRQEHRWEVRAGIVPSEAS